MRSAFICGLAIVVVAGCARAPRDEAQRGGEPPVHERQDVANASGFSGPIVLVSIDTLRSDHLPAYGYGQGQTPNIDRLAADGVLFEHAYSHCPLTLPSHLSVFTGRLPYEHGVRNNIGYTFDRESLPTLASLLKARGYATGASVSSYVLRAETGVSSGFDFYDDGVAVRNDQPLGRLERRGQQTLSAATTWLEGAPRSFFFFLHLFEPHSPYDPPPEFRQVGGGPYDGEISAADAVVGELLDWLSTKGLYAETLIVLLSDHGEGLGDHGESEHGVFLYREALQVPLVLKLPQSEHAGLRVTTPVQLIDVLPTVLGIVGVGTAERAPDPKGGQGKAIPGDSSTGPPLHLAGTSLLDVAFAGNRSRPLYSETLYPRIHLGWSELRSVIDGFNHFIAAPEPELYDLAADPNEQTNRYTADPEVARLLESALSTHHSDIELPQTLDAGERQRLEALGYLGSGGPSNAAGDDRLVDPKARIGELEQLRDAFILAKDGEVDESIRRLELLLRESPGNQDALAKLASLYTERGDYEAAAAWHRRALELEPRLASEHEVSLASLALKSHRPADARRYIAAFRRQQPLRARLLEAQLALQEGRLAEARSLAMPLRDDPQSYYPATLVVGESLAKGGDPAGALAVADEALARAAASKLGAIEALHFLRGDALARLERYDEAEAAFEEEIHLFPRRVETYASLSVLQAIRGDRAEAAATLERMVAANEGRRALELAVKTSETLRDEPGASRWRRQLEASR